jgi:hypothetical protein
MTRGEGSGERRRGVTTRWMSSSETRKSSYRAIGERGAIRVALTGIVANRPVAAGEKPCLKVHDLGRADFRSLPSRATTAAIRRQRTRGHPSFDAFATTRDTREDETALDRATDEESASARRF